MANTYTYHGPGERWVEGEPTASDLLNVARENADHLHEALNTLMDTDNPGTGFLGDWASPFTLHTTLNDGWLAMWVDRSDAAGFGVKLRLKSGITQIAATPSSETDGVAVSVS